MKDLWRPLVLGVLTVTLAADLSARQPTVEERLDRLERKVDDLYSHLGVAPEAPPEVSVDADLLFGQPECADTVRHKQHHVICHRDEWKIPEWVTYHPSSENLDRNARRTDDFRPDPVLPEGRRSQSADYRNRGYDRGHMAPVADFKRREIAMSEVFLKQLAEAGTIQNVLRVRMDARSPRVHTLADDCEIHIAGSPESIELGWPPPVVVEPPNLCGFVPIFPSTLEKAETVARGLFHPQTASQFGQLFLRSDRVARCSHRRES